MKLNFKLPTIEDIYIEEIRIRLSLFNGDRVKVAQTLGINPNEVRQKIKKFQIKIKVPRPVKKSRLRDLPRGLNGFE